jgi:hypothetical protein
MHHSLLHPVQLHLLTVRLIAIRNEDVHALANRRQLGHLENLVRGVIAHDSDAVVLLHAHISTHSLKLIPSSPSPRKSDQTRTKTYSISVKVVEVRRKVVGDTAQRRINKRIPLAAERAGARGSVEIVLAAVVGGRAVALAVVELREGAAVGGGAGLGELAGGGEAAELGGGVGCVDDLDGARVVDLRGGSEGGDGEERGEGEGFEHCCGAFGMQFA